MVLARCGEGGCKRVRWQWARTTPNPR